MGPNAGVAEKCRWLREAKRIGTSGPIDADGVGLQRPEQASSRGIGRGRSICEYDEIMQIPPGSSDDALLINASSALCNMADHSELEIQKFEPLPHSEIASFRAAKLPLSASHPDLKSARAAAHLAWTWLSCP